MHGNLHSFERYLAQTRDEPLYLILGVQGSGTNLLSRLLRRIFNFSLMLDRSLVFNAAARLGKEPGEEAIVRAIREVTTHVFPSAATRKLSKYAIQDNRLFEGLNDVLTPSRVRCGADLARLVYAYRAYSMGTTRMGIKSDDVWETLGSVDDVLPNRRIIFITRDFRDNVVSIGGKAWGPVDPLRSALYVKQRLTPYAAEYRRAGPLGFHVKFSSLVNSPFQFVERFSQHFGLTPVVDPASVLDSFTFRPGKIERWRSLSPDHLAWCEGILFDELVEFGYPPESAERRLPSRLTLMKATARDALLRLPQKIQRFSHRLSK